MPDSDASASNADGDAGTGRRTKVQRVIDQRGFDELGYFLEQRWTKTSGERMSLRELADYVNRRVLEDELGDTTIQLLDTERDTVYRALTDDDIESETHVPIQRRLEREGIDVEELTNDFVTHQAIHTYLTKTRGVDSPETDSEPDPEGGLETINRLQSRLTDVVTKTLASLRNAGVLTLGDFTAYVNVNIVCSDCGAQYEVNELFEDGGCECDDNA